MKEKSVLFVIVVFLCFCLSFGSGDERIDEARLFLRSCYHRLTSCFKYQDTLRPRSTIYRHLNEVKDKQATWQNWLQEHIGYELAQLNKPPWSSMSEDILKFATEYHLLLSAWYYLRSITLNQAAGRQSHASDKYPDIKTCKKAALTALKHSTNHNNFYLQYFQALGKEARKDIMEQVKFSNYKESRKQNHKDAFSNLKEHLEKVITRLLGRKMTKNPKSVKRFQSIKAFLTPTGMTLNEHFLSDIRNFFPVEDFALPPHQASRRDKEFLEMAWLFNRHRSLWYKQRRIDFLKFLRYGEEDITANFIQRVEEAIKFANNRFQKYDSLYKDYYNVFQKHNSDKTAISQDKPFEVDFMETERQSHISEDEAFEPIQWRGKRKRTRLTKIEKIDSAGTHEKAENQSLDGAFNNLISDRSALDELGTLDDVDCLEELYQPALGDWYPSFLENCQPNTLITNEYQKPPLLIQVVEDCSDSTIAADFVPDQREARKQLQDSLEKKSCCV